MELTVLQNSLIMLQNRGADIGGYANYFSYNAEQLAAYTANLRKSNTILDPFSKLVKEKLSKYGFSYNDRTSLTYKIGDTMVFFADIGSALISKNMLTAADDIAIEFKDTDKVNNLIVIGQGDPSPGAKETLTASKNKFKLLQFFKDEELYSSPMDCVWSCQYKIYTKEETQHFFNVNNLSIIQMPRLYITDPIMKWLGAQAGVILKETNSSFLPNTLVKEDYYYRYLVE